MVDMTDPRLGEQILDPACGTGGFLVCAIEHLRSRDVKSVEDRQTLQGSFLGIEKKQLPHLLCTTNLLFFEKGQPTEAIWYFEHPYPAGYKSYSKTKPIRVEEFEREKAWWGGAGRKGRQESEHAWRVPVEQIRAGNYNLDSKNPYSADQGPGDPDALLDEYNQLQQDIEAVRRRLKQELGDALGHTIPTSSQPPMDVAFISHTETRRSRRTID